MKISTFDVNVLSEQDEFIDNNRFQKFRSKKRKLTGKTDISRCSTSDSGLAGQNPYLDPLIEDGVLDELVCIIKSGKEATVYLGLCNNEYLAVKLYTDIRVRSFRKDDIYRQGRYIGEKRIEKAIEQGSKFGLDAHQMIWVGEEFRQMKRLHLENVPVPKPVAISGLAIAMEFIGTEDGDPAPRISDMSLSKDEAEDAFRQSLGILSAIHKLGKVHGDFSAFNLLLHNGKVTAIDFPQMIDAISNNDCEYLLRRDIASLCKSFRKFGIKPDEERICRQFHVKYL